MLTETGERLIRGVDYTNRSENLRLLLARFPRDRVSPRTVVTGCLPIVTTKKKRENNSPARYRI